ncbi:flagellin [Sphingomonas vulcanisoli]|uniref:Flagellin n=1 Tax=Sphingomonas vulcanisoli TaxID=1658060 RepID=A0ABX0TVN2_9SPHN|nr:flagellin [Sphingomonas vulcanisoli]NIJ09572.1 flagellin [Sphingomonas vulcanisoli]
MTVINTNVSALRAQNGSRMADAALSQAMQRLSSGKRINSAQDDAAGLAIANSMTSQITGMNQAIRNSNDGISMAQTADGALSEVTNMLQRIRELAVEASSGTYSSSDKTNLQSEVSQLASQITSVTSNTKFNGIALFSGAAGSSGTVTIQTGASASDTVDMDFTQLDLSAVSSVDLTTGASAALTSVDTLIGTVSGKQAKFGAAESRLNSVVNNLTSNVTNLSQARSQIQDADYSTETSALAKAQILSQASTAMLAQANQSSQNVLTLLK